MSEEVKNKSEYLVEVRDLKQYFPIKTGFMKTTPLKAVDGVSFSIKPGETLGLVGESGCGKSTVGRQLVGLETPTGGRLFYHGKDMEKLLTMYCLTIPLIKTCLPVTIVITMN